MSRKALLIVNPYSGKKKGETIAKEIAEKLLQKEIRSEIFISHSLEELQTEIHRIDLSEFLFAGIIGGDGTMHEFINAVLRVHEKVPLPIALFPCGTGNAFNFDIGCDSVESTLQCIFSNTTSTIDLARVQFPGEVRWSFNILGCGLVASINQLAEKLRLFGGSRYTIASLIKLFANPKFHLKVTTDQGTFSGSFSFVLACNTRYTGKGMMMAPRAELSDGKFDVLLVRSSSALKLLKLFPKIFKGEHLGADILEYYQTTKLEVISENKKLFTNIDGEIIGETPFAFTVHDQQVEVFVKK